MSALEKLLKQWARAVADEQFHTAAAFCAPPGTRRAELHRARMAERKAAKLERIIRLRYGVDPYEAIRKGLIK